MNFAGLGAPNLALGASELIGARGRRGGRIGASELIGAAEAAGQITPSQASQLREEIYGRNAMIVQEREWTKSREYILPFTFLAVGSGLSATLSSSPQWPFRPYRVVVPSSIAPSVLINSINVGQQPAFAADGAVSAEGFSEVAWGTHICLDSASPGINITVTVTNTSAAPLDIRLMMLGDAARD